MKTIKEIIDQANSEVLAAFAIDLKKYQNNPPMTAGEVQLRQAMREDFWTRFKRSNEGE